MSKYIKDAYILFFTNALVDKGDFSTRKDVTLPMLKELIDLKLVDSSFASLNPNVTVKFIKENPSYKWNYIELSMNRNITPEFYDETIDKGWCPDVLYKNKAFLQRGLNSTNSAIFYYLNYNPALTWEIILEHKEKPWKWKKVCEYVRLTKKAVNAIASLKLYLSSAHFLILSERKELTWQMIENYLDLPWDFHTITSIQPDLIPWNFIETYMVGMSQEAMKISFAWGCLCIRKDLTFDYVQAHPLFPWQWEILYMNEKVFTQRQIDEEFDFEKHYGIHFLQHNTAIPLSYLSKKLGRTYYTLPSLAARKDITVAFIRENYRYMSENTDEILSKNPHITEEFVNSLPKLDWSVRHLAGNENISVAFIIKMSHKYFMVNPENVKEYLAEKIVDRIFQRKNLTYKDIMAIRPLLELISGMKTKYFNLLQIYIFRNPKKAATSIQRAWRKHYQRKLKKIIHTELALLPPTKNGWFLGGEEYRKSSNDFRSKVDHFKN